MQFYRKDVDRIGNFKGEKAMKKMKTVKDSQPWSEREKVLLLLLLVSVIDIPSLIDTLYQIGYEFGQALALWF